MYEPRTMEALNQQRSPRGGNKMRSTMKARIATGNRGSAICGVCRGSGQDPRVPFRHTLTGRVIHLVRACPGCGGSGTPVPEGDRDLTLV